MRPFCHWDCDLGVTRQLWENKVNSMGEEQYIAKVQGWRNEMKGWDGQEDFSNYIISEIRRMRWGLVFQTEEIQNWPQ